MKPRNTGLLYVMSLRVEYMKRFVKYGTTWNTGMGFLVASGVLAAGCGGGAGSGSTPTGPTTQSVGIAKAGFIGHAKSEISTSSSGITVSGLSGAAFTYIDLYPQKLLNNTNIAFARGGQIWIYNLLTGTTNMITALTGNAGFSGGPSWTTGGKLVFSTALANGTPTGATYTCFMDGSGLGKKNAATLAVTQRPAYSPDQGHIAGYDSAGDLCVEAYNGNNPTLLVSHTKLDQVGTVSWLNASTVVFQENVSGTEQLFQVSDSGSGTPTQIAGFNNSTTGTYDLQASVSFDGSTVAYNSGTAAAPVTTIVNLGNGNSLNVTPPNINYSNPTIAPNNADIAFWGADAGQTSNDGSYGIYTALIDGEQPTLVAADPSGTGGPLADTSSYPTWQPFPTYQRMVGASAPLGTTSSGFFLAQNGDAFSSFLSFTAVTPSKVTVTPPTTSSTAAALVYTVTADTISSLEWTNGYYIPATVQALSGATGFLVSFSGSSGQVVLVSTFEGPTSQLKRMSTTSTAQATYTGRFKAVFDEKGHNLAPNGATTLEIDQKSGKLVSFQ